MKIRRFVYFVTGAAIGYVVGAAAGRERYEAIVGQVSQVANSVGVPEFGSRLADRGAEVARSATDAASDIVDKAADKAGDFVDAAADKATGTIEDTNPKKPGSTF